jgi:hypothetical protein
MPTLAVAAIAAGVALSGPPAVAQSPSAAQPPAVSQQDSNVPDQKLDATAAAMRQVVSVKQNYQQKMASAGTEEKQRLANEAEAALNKAVTDQGISVEEYRAILVVAQNHPQVREKLSKRLHPDQ